MIMASEDAGVGHPFRLRHLKGKAFLWSHRTKKSTLRPRPTPPPPPAANAVQARVMSVGHVVRVGHVQIFQQRSHQVNQYEVE